MALTKVEKNELIPKFAVSKTDTGSPEVQIVLLTARIQKLTEHFESHKGDLHSKRGFIKMVKQRQKLLSYLKKEAEKRYTKLIDTIGLRK